ncbi:MAG: DCC1-like thiol-disulfide oxidoreductase family protein [Nitrosospira sp.]
MVSADIAPKLNRLSVIYDGECPFCNRFMRLYSMRRNAGDIELINARERPALIQELRSKGMEINDGMVAIWHGHYYYGAESMHLLSILGAELGTFTMLNKLLFRNRHAAGAIYPALAAGRRLILLLLRRKLIPD